MHMVFQVFNYAGSGPNVATDLVDPQLGHHLQITDMLFRGFLGRRARICTWFVSKPNRLNSNQ